MASRSLHFSLGLSLSLFACAGDGGGSTDDGSTAGTTGAATATDTTAGPGTDTDAGTDTDTGTGSTTGMPFECNGGVADDPLYEPPGECYNNAGCPSCMCVTFRDSPPDPGATCEEPAGPGMRVTATVLSFPDASPIAAAEVALVKAIDVLGGIDMAPAQAQATSELEGRIDVTFEPDDPIGIVAVITGAGHFPTATGIAPPPYEPANAVHDLYMMPEATLQAYNAELMKDAALAEFLPLGEMGGVVGVARNRYTGDPVAGVTVVSKTNGDATTAIIRYLNGDGTFGDAATTDTGLYVLVNPGLAEEFEAVVDGAVVSTRANKAGSGPGGVFTMNLSLDIDPGFDPFP